MRQPIPLLALAFLTVAAAGQAQMIVAPNSNTVTPGNTDNRFPFLVSGGQRYQQVYQSNQFSTLSGPELITQIALRPGPFVFQSFSTTLPDIQIDLSTTSLGPDALSSTFANNVGSNDTVVYARGALTLSSTNTPGVFDTVINLTTPFLYDPSAGNLLLDVRNFGGANGFVGSVFFDAQNTPRDSVSRVWGPEGNEGVATGTADSFGLITQFTFTPASAVPEPGSVALLTGLGLTGSLFALRRLRRSK